MRSYTNTTTTHAILYNTVIKFICRFKTDCVNMRTISRMYLPIFLFMKNLYSEMTNSTLNLT